MKKQSRGKKTRALGMNYGGKDDTKIEKYIKSDRTRENKDMMRL